MPDLTANRLNQMQSGLQALGLTPEVTGGSAPLILDAMTGVDIQCSIMMPKPPNWEAFKRTMGLPETYDFPAVRLWAELETLSISSARSVSAIRRLGESHAYEYTRGGRTIGGSMVFTSFNRDVFAEMYKVSPAENLNTADGGNPPMHVDQIPPFNVVINAVNEYGVVSSAILAGVHLTNFGTTFSIHDLKTEATYTYVAEHFFPVVKDPMTFMERVFANEKVVDLALSRMNLDKRDNPYFADGPTSEFFNALDPDIQDILVKTLRRAGIELGPEYQRQ